MQHLFLSFNFLISFLFTLTLIFSHNTPTTPSSSPLSLLSPPHPSLPFFPFSLLPFLPPFPLPSTTTTTSSSSVPTHHESSFLFSSLYISMSPCTTQHSQGPPPLPRPHHGLHVLFRLPFFFSLQVLFHLLLIIGSHHLLLGRKSKKYILF